MSIFLPRGRNFAKIFCPGAGNLTTLTKFPWGQPGGGGCWCLELTDTLVESRELFFLEAEIADNTFLLDVLRNMRQIKSYDDMFQVIRALTVQKNSQNKNLK